MYKCETIISQKQSKQMKKLLLVLSISVAIAACNNSSDAAKTGPDSTATAAPDSTSKMAPDSTKKDSTMAPKVDSTKK